MRKNKLEYVLLILSSLLLLQCGKKESAAARDVEAGLHPNQKVFLYTSPREIYVIGGDGEITTQTIEPNSFEFSLHINNGLNIDGTPKSDSKDLVISSISVSVSGSYQGKSFESAPSTPDYKKLCSVVLANINPKLARRYYAIIPRGKIFVGYRVTTTSCINYSENAAPETYVLYGLPKVDGKYKVKVELAGWFAASYDQTTQELGEPLENFKKTFYFTTE